MWQYNKYKKKKSSTPKESKPKVKKEPDYADKLDRVFSLYIRLRDCMPNGMCRCISCGQIKEFAKFDCGHYFSRSHIGTRWDEDNCNAECQYCLTPDSLILMSDLRWKPLGELTEGDSIVSFDETNGSKKKDKRKYHVGKVTHIHREVQDVYEVTLENGDKIKTTKEHKWLCREGCGTTFKWRTTGRLWVNGVNVDGEHRTGPGSTISTTVCKVFQVVNQDQSNDAGWLAGMLDADGHICQQNIYESDGSVRYGLRIGISQCEQYPQICKKIVSLINKFAGRKECTQRIQSPNNKLNHTCNTYSFLVTGSNVEKVQFLQKVRPLKLEKVDIEKLGTVKSQYDSKVVSVKHIGKQEIVVMETDYHTFFANGYAMHNCNRMTGGEHMIGYRENLIKKIGMQRFQLLEVKAHGYSDLKKDPFKLKLLIDDYQKKTDILLKQKHITR